GHWAAVWGARIALVPTLLQLVVGTLVLMHLPALQRERLMGSDLLTGGVFLASLLLAFALMHKLAVISQSEVTRLGSYTAVGLMAATVLLMVAARHTAQAGTYDQIESQATQAATTELNQL